MKILLSFFNIFVRVFTCMIPFKALRRKIRANYIFTQTCPKGAKYYIVKNGKKKRCHFVKFGLTIQVYGDNNEIIIDESASFAKSELVIRGSRSVFSVGKNSSVNNAKFRLYGCDKKMSIGEDCMFSYDVEIWSGDGHAIFCGDAEIPYNIEKDLMIGNHVWIGAFSRIIKGACIPDNSIVGMASVVNKHFSEKNVIISGIPASIVKTNIRWEQPAPHEFRTPKSHHMEKVAGCSSL